MNEQRPVPPIPAVPVHRQPQPVPQSQQGLPKIGAMPVQPVRKNDPNLEPLELMDDIAASGVSTPVAPPSPPQPVASVAAAPAQREPVTVNSVLGPNASKIKAFGVGMSDKAHLTKFNRQPTVTGRGAIRVRTFHGRLSDEGLAYMDDKINEWLDTHPEIEVKFTTSTVGMYDGKMKEPALILNVWF